MSEPTIDEMIEWLDLTALMQSFTAAGKPVAMIGDPRTTEMAVAIRAILEQHRAESIPVVEVVMDVTNDVYVNTGTEDRPVYERVSPKATFSTIGTPPRWATDVEIIRAFVERVRHRREKGPSTLRVVCMADVLPDRDLDEFYFAMMDELAAMEKEAE